jgi:phosphoglycolate phosphatase
LERTRALAYFLDEFELVKPGFRVLHFAPEHAIGKKILNIVGPQNYEAYDLLPELYHSDLNVRKFDLSEPHNLRGERYDLIVHCHILEHIPIYTAVVLWHLQRALTQNGKHIFFLPVLPGMSATDFGASDEERTARFGQADHIRKFGFDDLERTIGQVLHLGSHSHGIKLPADVAVKHNMSVNEVARTMFIFSKDDLRLR